MDEDQTKAALAIVEGWPTGSEPPDGPDGGSGPDMADVAAEGAEDPTGGVSEDSGATDRKWERRPGEEPFASANTDSGLEGTVPAWIPQAEQERIINETKVFNRATVESQLTAAGKSTTGANLGQLRMRLAIVKLQAWAVENAHLAAVEGR
jgi:hypothetical protein